MAEIQYTLFQIAGTGKKTSGLGLHQAFSLKLGLPRFGSLYSELTGLTVHLVTI